MSTRMYILGRGDDIWYIMKKILLTTATLMAFHINPVLGATSSFTATLEFAKPLTLTEAQDLNFGVVTGANGTVNTAGDTTGSAQVIHAGHPAIIDVNGAADAG